MDKDIHGDRAVAETYMIFYLRVWKLANDLNITNNNNNNNNHRL